MHTATTPLEQNHPGLQALQNLIAGDLQEVNRLIEKRLHSEIALINQVAFYVINSGGKRIRPILLLLSAGAFSYKGRHHIALAAIIEFIHTATLLHDDVVDASKTRRGQESANMVWGNEASVLVGDFLYSRAFQMMVDIGDMEVMSILAHATNTIAEGEVLQLLNQHNADTHETQYLEVIHCKTAKLFEAASHLGAVLCQRNALEKQALAAYGMHLGTAFQLIDDVLDYTGNPEAIGKNVGDDLAEGKPTLPLIYALHHGTPSQQQLIRQAVEQGGREHIAAVIETIASTGAITYTENLAQGEAAKAAAMLKILPASPYRDALFALAEFSVTRQF